MYLLALHKSMAQHTDSRLILHIRLDRPSSQRTYDVHIRKFPAEARTLKNDDGDDDEVKTRNVRAEQEHDLSTTAVNGHIILINVS